jgi:hypothetical protein
VVHVLRVKKKHLKLPQISHFPQSEPQHLKFAWIKNLQKTYRDTHPERNLQGHPPGTGNKSALPIFNYSSVKSALIPVRLVRSIQFWQYHCIQAIPARDQCLTGSFMAVWSRNLSRIELRRESIESPGVNGFELGDADTPLIRRDLQPIKDRR